MSQRQRWARLQGNRLGEPNELADLGIRVVAANSSFMYLLDMGPGRLQSDGEMHRIGRVLDVDTMEVSHPLFVTSFFWHGDWREFDGSEKTILMLARRARWLDSPQVLPRLY